VYSIILQTDGKYRCVGLLQDGTERWIESTFEEAVASMKQFSKQTNHQKIKRKDIEYLRDVQRIVWDTEPWTPPAKP
jgi:hypothetical protein